MEYMQSAWHNPCAAMIVFRLMLSSHLQVASPANLLPKIAPQSMIIRQNTPPRA